MLCSQALAKTGMKFVSTEHSRFIVSNERGLVECISLFEPFDPNVSVRHKKPSMPRRSELVRDSFMMNRAHDDDVGPSVCCVIQAHRRHLWTAAAAAWQRSTTAWMVIARTVCYQSTSRQSHDGSSHYCICHDHVTWRTLLFHWTVMKWHNISLCSFHYSGISTALLSVWATRILSIIRRIPAAWKIFKWVNLTLKMWFIIVQAILVL